MGNKTSRQSNVESVEKGANEGRTRTCTYATTHLPAKANAGELRQALSVSSEKTILERGPPESCMYTDPLTTEDDAEKGAKNNKSSCAVPARKRPLRSRIKRTRYSDDTPGTVTFEEQFGDGKEKEGEKQWVRNDATGEWMIKVGISKQHAM